MTRLRTEQTATDADVPSTETAVAEADSLTSEMLVEEVSHRRHVRRLLSRPDP